MLPLNPKKIIAAIGVIIAALLIGFVAGKNTLPAKVVTKTEFVEVQKFVEKKQQVKKRKKVKLKITNADGSSVESEVDTSSDELNLELSQELDRVLRQDQKVLQNMLGIYGGGGYNILEKRVKYVGVLTYGHFGSYISTDAKLDHEVGLLIGIQL